MHRIKSALKILIIQILIVIFLLEFIGLFQKSPSYFWEYRYLYYSQNPIRQVDTVLWTYNPNSDIRFIASYALSRSRPWIEYDCRFKTNGLGLIDTNFVINKDADWLILGDSFTEGHGGCPWLTRKTIDGSSLSNTSIINGGLQGAGVQQFEKLLNYLEKMGVVFKNVVVVVISNDFKRPLLQENYWVNQGECLNNLNCNDGNYWWGISSDASRDEIILKTKGRINSRSGGSEIQSILDYYSFSYRVFKRFKTLIFPKTKEFPKNSMGSVYQENFDSLSRIRQKYPKMKVLLIPQRDEVGLLGVQNLDTKAVEKFLADHQYGFSTCELTSLDYMPIDGHPNKLGYEKIFRCLEDTIKDK